jgi:hypothetical protein
MLQLLNPQRKNNKVRVKLHVCNKSPDFFLPNKQCEIGNDIVLVRERTNEGEIPSKREIINAGATSERTLNYKL